MVQGRITESDSPAGRHPFQTSHLHHPLHFYAGSLPAATFPIYSGLGQAQEYAALHTPVGSKQQKKTKLKLFSSNSTANLPRPHLHQLFSFLQKKLPETQQHPSKSVYFLQITKATNKTIRQINNSLSEY